MAIRNTSSGTICDLCSKEVRVVFLVDNIGIVYHPIASKEQVVLALIGATSSDRPSPSAYTTSPGVMWICENCIGVQYDGRGK